MAKKKNKKVSNAVRTPEKSLALKTMISGEDILLQIQAFEKNFQKRIGQLKGGESMTAERKIFVPHELKTIEIDVEKNVFRVNGEDFAKNCTGFNLDCSANIDNTERYSVCMDISTDIRFRANFDNEGRRTSGGFEKE